MTRDLKPGRHDLRRLVERYGSIAHAARALNVDKEEFDAWLTGKKELPVEYFAALLALVSKRK